MNVYIIAEVGVNHNGDMEMAQKACGCYRYIKQKMLSQR